MGEITKVWLNTWGNYNDGGLGYGWKTPEEAEEFIEDNPERDGGEWFIADIDDYIGIDLPHLNYRNVNATLELLQELKALGDFERDCIIAVMHDNNVLTLKKRKTLPTATRFMNLGKPITIDVTSFLTSTTFPIFSRVILITKHITAIVILMHAKPTTALFW